MDGWMMGFDNSNAGPGLGLGLGLGLGQHDDEQKHRQRQKKKELLEEAACINKASSYPSLSLGPPHHDHHETIAKAESEVSNSFSNSSTIKREREFQVFDEINNNEISTNINGNSTKKLRLTKQQSALLEDCFKDHSTLTPKQKQELAKKLNLRARQVEVWFQNRRARTKMKQTEVDCEILKKCCESLSEENKRLQREVQELKSMPGHLYMNMGVTVPSLTICPSCDTICSAKSGDINKAITPLFIAPNNPNHHFMHSPNHPQLAS